MTKETILNHIEKLVEQNVEVDISYLKGEISQTLFKKIEQAIDDVLVKTGDTKLGPIKTKLGASASYDQIKLVRVLMKA